MKMADARENGIRNDAITAAEAADAAAAAAKILIRVSLIRFMDYR